MVANLFFGLISRLVSVCAGFGHVLVSFEKTLVELSDLLQRITRQVLLRLLQESLNELICHVVRLPLRW